MAYATVNDVQARTTKTLTDAQIVICESLLDDVAVLIDSVAPSASDEVKLVVSCSVVVRTLGSQTEIGIPLGATQGSASALGYSQSWTVGNGAVGELYLSRTEKRMLGVGNNIGSYSPVEELAT